MKFWTDANFDTELSNRTWRVGQPVYFTLNWVERIFESNFIVEDCYWNDESDQKTYNIIQDVSTLICVNLLTLFKKGCASTLIDTKRYSAYAESTDNHHKFEFKAFAFSHESHKVSMTCRVKVCLSDEEGKPHFELVTKSITLFFLDCNRQSAACPSGYYDGSNNQLL